MIQTHTLFILGAGASKPFGYPTGPELRDRIIEDVFSEDIVDALSMCGDDIKYFNQELKIFRRAFARSGRYSIDRFLEHQPKFMEIGKMLIARILISYEEDSLLRNREENWYMHLLELLEVPFETLHLNNTSFITFNYDRSLEHFLFEAIRNQSGKNPEDCKEIMKNFPIVHLYGQLDPLPWQVEKGGTEYSSDVNTDNRVLAAPENIQLISGERDIAKSKLFDDAYRLLGKADRIFFLGFGFDKTNLERLQIEYMVDKEIFATVYKLKDAKLNWIKDYFAKRSIEITLDDLDALSMLHKYLPIE
jgi:hypothetical protein